jgi:hypothetical protein
MLGELSTHFPWLAPPFWSCHDSCYSVVLIVRSVRFLFYAFSTYSAIFKNAIPDFNESHLQFHVWFFVSTLFFLLILFPFFPLFLLYCFLASFPFVSLKNEIPFSVSRAATEGLSNDFAQDSANSWRSSNETAPWSYLYWLHTQPIVSMLKSTNCNHVSSQRPWNFLFTDNELF